MGNISIENNERLINAVELIAKVMSIGDVAYQKLNTHDSGAWIVDLFMGFIHRAVINLDAVNLLLKTYKTKPHVETSIGLILRANLLDFMMIEYLKSFRADIKLKDDDNEKEFDRQFSIVLADHIHYALRDLLSQKGNLITKEKYRLAVDDLYLSYKPLFKGRVEDYDSPKLVSKKPMSASGYFNRIKSHPSTKMHAMAAYDLYNYYSKYEHYGVITDPLQNQGHDNDVMLILDAINYIVIGLGDSLSFIPPDVESLQLEKEEIDKLGNAFNKLVS